MADYVKLTATSPIVNAPGAQHVYFTCEDHPELRWTCKNIAVGPDKNGDIRYNGSRNIFFASDPPARECDCPSSKLIGIEDPEHDAKLEKKYAYLRSNA